MREGDRIIIIAVPIALRAGEPHVMTDTCGGLPSAALEALEGDPATGQTDGKTDGPARTQPDGYTHDHLGDHSSRPRDSHTGSHTDSYTSGHMGSHAGSRTGSRAGGPIGGHPTDRQIQATLEALLVRKRRFPAASAEQLPVRVTQMENGARLIEIPYLVTTRMSSDEPGWVPCYDIMPWEDHRSETDAERAASLAKRLLEKCFPSETAPGLTPEQLLQRRRLNVLFAPEHRTWRPELILERYLALEEAGLLTPGSTRTGQDDPPVNTPMPVDPARNNPARNAPTVNDPGRNDAAGNGTIRNDSGQQNTEENDPLGNNPEWNDTDGDDPFGNNPDRNDPAGNAPLKTDRAGNDRTGNTAEANDIAGNATTGNDSGRNDPPADDPARKALTMNDPAPHSMSRNDTPGAGTLKPECCRWLASAMGHLRRPLRSLALPVELMPDRFTIPQFQAAAEGVLGQILDKQIFRRNAINSGFLLWLPSVMQEFSDPY
ncbi:hypothetical protein GOB93_08280 [Acetobacter musti]|uniref:NrtR DNA-binding winged helix domain-containing protein n=1 Tax=Acetobacter musti TaxID=864732 RepID=A0ABX0JQ42_9PROT|nr:hypothetical protein [Acetobacter musti]NHN84640.1 hypothetical protein [Acetobacter musti]